MSTNTAAGTVTADRTIGWSLIRRVWDERSVTNEEKSRLLDPKIQSTFVCCGRWQPPE